MARRDPLDRPVGDAVPRDEATVFAGRARALGLPFGADVDLGEGVRVDLDAVRAATIGMSADERRIYLAPEEEALPGILHWLNAYPSARPRIRVTTRTALRAALVAAAGEALARDAVGRLAGNRPDLSARRVASPPQILVALIFFAAIAIASFWLPAGVLIAVNLVGAVFFFGVTALRLLAAAHAGTFASLEPPPLEARSAYLPTYTILVPLYDEANMIPDLVAALDALDWPRDRLDIKLLLEADDIETIAAARAAAPGAPYEIVIVPPVGPRTKPKALSFALPFARGAFVTVYDAEDRPHPAQLREAFAAFRAAAPDVACFQSPLVIDNPRANWLTLSFAVEYAALFDGLLPLLAHLGMPLPLGGTSNHFRREALEAVGGWDPFNVTEDADLGIRLARFGYRCGTIDLPTLEEAPVKLGAWIGQRTRWFKGWMQTWLVHMRHPVKLARELGPRGLLGFVLIGTGLVVSSMIYPVYLATLLVMATQPLSLWGDGGVLAAVVVGVNLFNLVAGYLAMAVLSARALRLRGRDDEAVGIILLPLYWFLMSFASYRALWQLIVRPHHWEKTPHQGRSPQVKEESQVRSAD